MTTIFCPHCGSGNIATRSICVVCGASLDTASQEAAPVQRKPVPTEGERTTAKIFSFFFVVVIMGIIYTAFALVITIFHQSIPPLGFIVPLICIAFYRFMAESAADALAATRGMSSIKRLGKMIASG